MTHVSGHIRDEFLEEAATRGYRWDLLNKDDWPDLEHCTDVLPSAECASFDLPPGSTYADTWARMRRGMSTKPGQGGELTS